MDADRESPILSRRRFLSVAAAGVSSLALAACGGTATPATQPTAGGTAPEAATAAPAENAPTEVPTEVPTPTPALLGTGS